MEMTGEATAPLLAAVRSIRAQRATVPEPTRAMEWASWGFSQNGEKRGGNGAIHSSS